MARDQDRACAHAPPPSPISAQADKWIEGCGSDLPSGTLAWIDHPVLGIVWAEKEYYLDGAIDDNGDAGQPEKQWNWYAYGVGVSFGIGEATRYWLIDKPEPTHG